MAMVKRSSGMWLAALVLMLGLAALACNFGGGGEVEDEAAETTPAAVEEAPQAANQTAEQATEEVHALSLPAVMFGGPSQGEGAQLSGEGMPVIPAGWHYAVVEQEGLSGVLFSKQSPEALEAFDDSTQAVPADFAGGAFVKTALPAGAEPQAMLAGMEASMAELGDQDLEAMMITADQVGMLNLRAVDHAGLERVWAGELGGKPAIVMEGTIHFLDGKPPVLRAKVLLAWTEQAFYTLYLLASEAAWPESSAAFDALAGSINLP
jgi:hypothetical protein